MDYCPGLFEEILDDLNKNSSPTSEEIRAENVKLISDDVKNVSVVHNAMMNEARKMSSE
jgi:hypothetical protein